MIYRYWGIIETYEADRISLSWWCYKKRYSNDPWIWIDHHKTTSSCLIRKTMNTSMTQYRKHECYYCHALKPANEMHKKKVEEKSGRTSWGFSFNPARKKSGRIYTGRTHYKTREVWVCDSCVRTRSSLSFMQPVRATGRREPFWKSLSE